MADTTATAETQEGKDTKAQDRIKELDRRNKELEKLVNMKERIDRVESAVDLASRQAADREKPKQEEDKEGWGAFLEPRITPTLERNLQPIRNAILRLADENDHLRTLITVPKYRDPEIQAEVEQIRQDRLRQTGQLEPRPNIITFMKGQNPERFKDEEDQSSRREDAHVEHSAGVGGPRAASRAETRSAEDMSVEELEKWMIDNNYQG
jgi:hypothetical protein